MLRIRAVHSRQTTERQRGLRRAALVAAPVMDAMFHAGSAAAAAYPELREPCLPVVQVRGSELAHLVIEAHGGTMIQYAGWADAAIAPENGLSYYRKVTHTMGDPSDFYRVFMVRGMAHCSGGAGPNAFDNGTNNSRVIDADHDLVKALERWVAKGVAPDRIIATRYNNNAPVQGVQFKRPLCPYPQRASTLATATPTMRRASSASRITTRSIRATSDLSGRTKRAGRSS